MDVGRRIIKTLIVVLEGCVVKLKELEAYLDDRVNAKKDKAIKIEGYPSLRQKERNSSLSEENYFNISLLDNYIADLELPIGSNFMRIIQRTELKTEYNIISTMIETLSDIDKFYAMYDSIKGCKFVEFKYISPSPLRADEKKVVDKQFVVDELTEAGIAYDKEKSLYDNCLKVLEYKQKAVMDSITARFSETIERIQLATEELQKTKMIQVLQKELHDRKQIIEMKLKR